MHFYRKYWFDPFEEQFISPFLSDCLSLGIAIHYIQHSQAMLERGVCELAHSFFHFVWFVYFCYKNISWIYKYKYSDICSLQIIRSCNRHLHVYTCVLFQTSTSTEDCVTLKCLNFIQLNLSIIVLLKQSIKPKYSWNEI